MKRERSGPVSIALYLLHPLMGPPSRKNTSTRVQPAHHLSNTLMDPTTTTQPQYFTLYRLLTTPIVTTLGLSLEGVGVGTADLEFETSSGHFKLQLKEAMHVQKARKRQGS